MGRLKTPSGGPPSVCTGAFDLRGELGRPGTLTVADLRQGWEQHSADVVFQCASSGPRHHRFEGPL